MEEIERHWSLYDLLDAHEALDIREEIEEDARNRAESEMRKARR